MQARVLTALHSCLVQRAVERENFQQLNLPRVHEHRRLEHYGRKHLVVSHGPRVRYLTANIIGLAPLKDGNLQVFSISSSIEVFKRQFLYR